MASLDDLKAMSIVVSAVSCMSFKTIYQNVGVDVEIQLRCVLRFMMLNTNYYEFVDKIDTLDLWILT